MAVDSRQSVVHILIMCAIISKYLRKCEDTYLILQNKSLCIYEDSFGGKILRDDFALNNTILLGIYLPRIDLVHDAGK